MLIKNIYTLWDRLLLLCKGIQICLLFLRKIKLPQVLLPFSLWLSYIVNKKRYSRVSGLLDTLYSVSNKITFQGISISVITPPISTLRHLFNFVWAIC